MVLVPEEGFREYTGPVFPQGTVDFLHFLRDHAPESVPPAIAADDANYKEVALHSNIARLATIFVEYVAGPIVTSLIAAYLKDVLGSRFAKAEAHAAIIVHRKEKDAEQTVRISYDGPAPNAEQALRDALASLDMKPGPAPRPGARKQGGSARRKK